MISAHAPGTTLEAGKLKKLHKIEAVQELHAILERLHGHGPDEIERPATVEEVETVLPDASATSPR